MLLLMFAILKHAKVRLKVDELSWFDFVRSACVNVLAVGPIFQPCVKKSPVGQPCVLRCTTTAIEASVRHLPLLSSE